MANDIPCFRGWRLPTAALFLLLCYVDLVVAVSNRDHILEWQILTKRNFSSQIRLHPHILLIVTVPWSGESRSLMKELANLSVHKKERVLLPKLMVIYKHTDKMLADILGVTNEVTVFCYHYSMSYKYQGRLRAHNILSSFDHLVSLQPEDLPLKTLNTAEDIKAFLGSTDKSVLLLEFCGWSAKLLARGANRNGSSFHVQDATENGVIFGANLHGETNRTLPPKGKKNEKGLRNEKLTCEVKNGLNGIPWLERFSLANDGAPFLDSEFMTSGVGISCTFDEFQQFDSFFSKFTTTTREFFLPPERQRFGLVSDRALLSTLGVSDSDSYSWLVMLHYAGCPSCSEILKRGEDPRSVLQMHHSPVIELEGEGHDLEPALPINMPSVILFVDRSSESLDIRKDSVDALNTFRETAFRNELFHQRAGQHGVSFRTYSPLPSKGPSRSISSPAYPGGKQGGEFSSASQIVKSKDKKAVVIIHEDGKVAVNNIAAGEQFQSVNDILGHLLQQKKETKLSFLAKELGFQLLSDDFEVKRVDLLPSQMETTQSVEVPSEFPKEDIVESNPGKYNLPNTASATAVQPEELAGRTCLRPSPYQKEMGGYVEEDPQFISVEPDKVLMIGENRVPKVMGLDKESSVQIGRHVGQKIEHQQFRGCFFFSDGGNQLLRTLHGESKIPSMLILDPISQKHFVFPEEEVFSYTSLVKFLDGFSNGSLNSYQRSETIIKSPREPIHPPFVNLDFHEVDPIPQVTAETFSELVQGYSQLDSQNVGHASMKDVLVLFSNSWCGFCQRAKLVIREVHRALKGYLNVLQNGSRNGESLHITDKSKEAILNDLPQIFLMDCTLNDCNSLVESMGQKELYPALVLFPAGKKNAIFYKGDMFVTNVIKFLADHGSNSLISEGIMWNGAEKRGVRSYLSEKESPIPVDENDPLVKRNDHEIAFSDRKPAETIKNNDVGLYTSKDLYKASPHVLVGAVLTATDMLLSAPPFDNSVVLIVKADRSTGFEGLIINRHISWDILEAVNDGLELPKEAPLSFGGPLSAKRMPLVSLCRVVTKPGYPEVLPSVYFLDQNATIEALNGLNSGHQTVTDYWFFLGFSSWEWNQLFDEIAEGAWHVNNELGQLDWPQK